MEKNSALQADIYTFLANRTKKLCVLSTSFCHYPESAVMGYAVKDDLTILLSTHANTRKIQNIRANEKVSLVFGWGFDEPNIQCSGKATIIEGEDREEYATFFYKMNPEAEKFRSSDTLFISIKLIWIRFSDFTVRPPRIEEI